MNIRVTTDPMSMKDVPHPEVHPCVYVGDGDNGMEIYFESEQNKQAFMRWNDEDDHQISLQGNDVDDFVAEG